MRGRTSTETESYTWKDAVKFLVQGMLVIGISSLLIGFLKPYMMSGPPKWLSIAAAVLAIISFYALLSMYRGGISGR